MEQKDRDILIEIHTIIKDVAPLVKKHERDINIGKGMWLMVLAILSWLGFNK